jgi:hypothetical protein
MSAVGVFPAFYGSVIESPAHQQCASFMDPTLFQELFCPGGGSNSAEHASVLLFGDNTGVVSYVTLHPQQENENSHYVRSKPLVMLKVR